MAYKKTTLTLVPGELTLDHIQNIIDDKVRLSLDENALEKINAALLYLRELIARGDTIYGVNTGFGALSKTKISTTDIEELQEKIILSHATGVGPLLSDDIVRLILVLKINTLAQGHSGVRVELINYLLNLYNAEIYPCIPSKGSVGASGDLVPLSHLSLSLLGIGQATYKNEIIPTKKALTKANLNPFTLGPKEGLSLINGTQASAALALKGLLSAARLLKSSIIIGALSNDAAAGCYTHFDSRIHKVKRHLEQESVARVFQMLLKDSSIQAAHRNSQKVQDPYSLRCQPQILGACLAQIQSAANTLLNEANGVSDNPLIFPSDELILSGGNFHGEFIAMAADNLALAIAEIGSLSERRIALLMDSNFSGLPPFLTLKPGLNSGFMIAHVTASALASENKSLAHPASVDSIPTSANQEDHVSMSTYAARRLMDMCENTANILAIELLVACQGIDIRKPSNTSACLDNIIKKLRLNVTFMSEDRFFGSDIDFCKKFIVDGGLEACLPSHYLEPIAFCQNESMNVKNPTKEYICITNTDSIEALTSH